MDKDSRFRLSRGESREWLSGIVYVRYEECAWRWGVGGSVVRVIDFDRVIKSLTSSYRNLGHLT